MNRKRFFSDGIRELGANFLHSPVGQIFDRQLQGLSNLLAPESFSSPYSSIPQPVAEENYARPPGARLKDFETHCTNCGDCIVACPYGVIFQSGPESGPLIDPNRIACHLCEDFPCIQACETSALQPMGKDILPKFGQAYVQTEKCINHPHKGEKKSKACKKCQEACPVDVITYSKSKLPDISLNCTGCGLCVQVCPEWAIEVKI